MNLNEYNKLFHELELNLVAFKQLNLCDNEVLKLVNVAIEREREACARICEDSINAEHYPTLTEVAAAIRARGKHEP